MKQKLLIGLSLLALLLLVSGCEQENIQHGQLFITSTPNAASVYIDDELVGSTPFVQDVEAGSYALRVESANHQSWIRTVLVNPGEQVLVQSHLLGSAILSDVQLESHHAVEEVEIGDIVEELVHQLLQPLRPLQLVVVEVVGEEVYLARGSNQLFVGQRFEIVRPGKVISHPETGAVLGSTEEYQGILEVTRCRSTLCFTRLKAV